MPLAQPWVYPGCSTLTTPLAMTPWNPGIMSMFSPGSTLLLVGSLWVLRALGCHGAMASLQATTRWRRSWVLA